MKGILHRLTIWNQKFSQHIPEESVVKLGLFFSDFEEYSKSAQLMIWFLLVTCSYTPVLLKNAEKSTVMWLFTQNCLEAQCLMKATSRWCFRVNFVLELMRKIRIIPKNLRIIILITSSPPVEDGRILADHYCRAWTQADQGILPVDQDKRQPNKKF